MPNGRLRLRPAVHSARVLCKKSREHGGKRLRKQPRHFAPCAEVKSVSSGRGKRVALASLCI